MDYTKTTASNMKKKLLDAYSTNGIATHTFMTGGKLSIMGDELIKLYKFFNKFNKLPALTERLTKGSCFKFFIDIDEKNEINGCKNYYTDEEINTFINQINNILLNECSITSKYILMKNNCKNKYHIIYDFIVEIYKAKEITALINDRLNLKIDNSVYKSGLRILNAVKNNNDNSRYNIMVNNISTIQENIFLDTSILNIYNKPLINNKIPIVQRIDEVKIFNGEYKDVGMNEDKKILIELLEKKCDDIHSVELNENIYNGYNVNYDHNFNCPVSGKKHDKIQCYIKKFNNEAIKLYCFSHKCKNQTIILREGKKSIMNDEFFTDTTLSKLFIEHYGDNFVYQNKNVYYWNGDIWISGDTAENILQNTLSKEFYKIIVDIILESNVDIMKWSKIALCLQSRKRKPYIIKEICGLITNTNIIFDNNDNMDYCLNFKNGIVDLKKIKYCSNGDYSNAFRKRTKEDYIQYTLDYDFIPNKLDNNKLIIDKIFSAQLPNNKEKEFIYRWFGYCMTGDTTEQKYLCSIGYSASNGKSTQSKIFNSCLPLYSMKFDNRIFSENYSKSHKQFIHLQDKPIRYTYIEEIDQANMNANLLKDYVDGDKLQIERLYSNCEDVKLKAKLNICSNLDLTLKNADEGTLRRGIQLNFNIKFVSKNKYAQLEDKTGCAIGNKNLIKDLFNNDENKNAFIHLLLDRITDVIDNGLDEDIYMTNNFTKTMEEYDTFKTFINDNYVKGDHNDKISIVDFLDDYNDTLPKKITRNALIKECKRVGYVYDRDKRINNIKGVIIGLKKIE